MDAYQLARILEEHDLAEWRVERAWHNNDGPVTAQVLAEKLLELFYIIEK